MKTLIGFMSDGSGAGKSTAARRLVQIHRFFHLKLSYPFKEMLRGLLYQLGYSSGAVDLMIEGSRKWTPIPELGNKTPVDLMISLGQDWGRGMVDNDIWVSIAAIRIRLVSCMPLYEGIVIDDIRQKNEVDYVLQHGGFLVRVNRSGTKKFVVDGLLTDVKAHYTIENDSDIDALYRKVDEIVSACKESSNGRTK